MNAARQGSRQHGLCACSTGDTRGRRFSGDLLSDIWLTQLGIKLLRHVRLRALLGAAMQCYQLCQRLRIRPGDLAGGAPWRAR